MSFPTYPEYKPSGFDWLPEVPAHWRDRKIARDIPFVVGWTPPSGKDEYYDGDLPWVTIADMTQMSVEDTKSKISHLAVQDKGAKVVPAGSMLFSFKLSVGKIAFLTIDSYTNEAIAGFLPCGPLDLEYWKYAAPEFIPRYGRENIYGATLLNQELISSVRFSAPLRAEQTQIARFLDHETARIDALIEEQQRLIELLKEKRQAVISHAVTKGLDPTVPMKDSGVEWLGEVPAHWDISNIKRVATIRYGIGEPPQYHPEGVPLIRATNVHAGKLFSQGLVFVDPAEIPARRIVWLESGDIVVVRSGAYTGDSAIIPHEYGSCIAGFDMVLRCHSAQPDFIQFALLSKYLKEGQLDLEKMRAAQPHLNAEELGACMLVLPGMEEQIRIVEFLQIRCTEFDILMTEAEQAKSLLQERRSALISAAVTGKIDVRGWQPPASTQAPKFEVVEVV